VIQKTPPIGNEKDFAGRPDVFLRKVHTLHYNPNAERNSMENLASDDVQNVKSFIDKESESNGPLTPKTKETENQRLNLLDDHEVSFYYKSPLLVLFLPFLIGLSSQP
jgi:hypothetical protein